MFNDGQPPGGDPPQQPLQPQPFGPPTQLTPELIEQIQRMLQMHTSESILQALQVQSLMAQNILRMPNMLQVAPPAPQFVVPQQASPLLLSQNPAFAAAHSVEQFIAQEEGRNRVASPVRQVPVVQVQQQIQQPQQVLPTSIPIQVSPEPLQPVQNIPNIQNIIPIQQEVPQQVQQPVPVVHQPQQFPPATPQSTSGTPSTRGGRTGKRGGGRKKKVGDTPPRVDEALTYLRVIKQTFCNDVPVYHRFLDIMKDFRAQRIDTPDVIEQVAELLYTSPELVLGFNTFLPAGYRISQNADKKYVFTAPQALPKVLPSPEERQAIAASTPKQEPSTSGTSNDVAPAVEPKERRGESVESGETENDEENDDENGGELVEEVVLINKKVDEELELMDDEKTDQNLEAESLKVLELLAACFRARPSKILGFTTFLEYYLGHCKYYSSVAGQDEHDELKERNEQYMVSSLAKVCHGEPALLVSILDFLPHLQTIMDKYGKGVVTKMDELLHDPSATEKSAESADRELSGHLEKCNMGTSSFEHLQNESLRISKKRKASSMSDDASGEPLIVLGKSQRVLYLALKDRCTEHQLNNLLVLFGMFMNLDLSAARLVGEVSKVMGIQGTEVENVIRRMVNIEPENRQRPENDPDAKMKSDLPAPQHAKRGLRDQKMLQQVKNVEAATVCTLGPSYRLMKDTNAKESECTGRIELEPHLKEVINDTWTSYPSWSSSEDAGTQAVKKSNLEEFHFKTEEERYELDIMIDSNRSVIEQLTKELRELESRTEEEKRHYKLDDALNCSSKATVTRVLTKVYTNSANEMMEAAQRNPATGLRKLLEGLREKDTQWSRFQQDTNRTWRDALDKQMTSAMSVLNNQQKQYDQKAFKSKPLVNAIEQVLDERRKTNTEDGRPHLVLDYTSEKRIYRDVNDVTAHFFHDLPGGKSDKDRTKLVLFSYRILMEWMCQQGQHVQVDLDNGDIFKFQGDLNEDENLLTLLNMDGRRVRSDRVVPITNDSTNPTTTTATTESSPTASTSDPTNSTNSTTTSVKDRFLAQLHDKKKRVFFGDDNVYMIVRYHHMIQERFTKLMATQAVYSQEHLDNQKKNKRWEEGVGADMHGRRVLDENMRTRREAVNDIRNIRTCPSSYYDLVIRELKQLGNAQLDMASFEESVRALFPADVALFNSIDKLLSSLAKNIHHATCADEKENPVKLYLRFRKRMEEAVDEHARRLVEQEYASAADETLRGKNTYRFEFVNEPNAPRCNVWVIPREEKESSAAENDDEEGEKEGGANEEQMPQEKPTSNDDDEEDEDSEGGGKTPAASGTN